MAPSPKDVMESIEDNYDYDCRLTTDESIDIVDPEVEFVVEDVPPEIAQDIAKFVSVRGYQAYMGEIKDPQTGDVPICKTENV